MDIRQAIYTKLHNVSKQELKEIIEEGIASQEETILPGLGVLFETYYNSLSSKDELLMQLSQLLK
ncbi:MAG: small acid-soluble spore protein SspI [Faecalibacillus sp.]